MEKVIVDKDICISCGFCCAACPNIFDMDDDDKAIAKDNDVTNENKVEIMDIVEGCPVGAIIIEEE